MIIIPLKYMSLKSKKKKYIFVKNFNFIIYIVLHKIIITHYLGNV